jgi:hypothetical protein
VKHVLDRITIIFRALFDLHTRYFVWWDEEIGNPSFNEF